MSFDLSLLTALVALALSTLNLFAAVRNIMSEGEKKIDERLKKAESTLISHDRRIQTVEGDMKHLPTRESQHRTELALSEMNGRFAALEEKLKPIAATSERLHELLMEQARK